MYRQADRARMVRIEQMLEKLVQSRLFQLKNPKKVEAAIEVWRKRNAKKVANGVVQPAEIS